MFEALIFTPPATMPRIEQHQKAQGGDASETWFPSESAFTQLSNGFVITETGKSPTSATSKRIVIRFKGSDFDSEHKKIKSEPDTIPLKQTINNLCHSLNLSKSAFADVMGVSRQTIYDWIAGRNEALRDGNDNKLIWLETVAANLEEDAKKKIWLWRNKKLENSQTVIENLKNSSVAPEAFISMFSKALNDTKQHVKIKSISENASKRPLNDKSTPFSNNA